MRLDLWTPITISRGMGQKPLSLYVWFAWHVANAAAIAASYASQDPFPQEAA